MILTIREEQKDEGYQYDERSFIGYHICIQKTAYRSFNFCGARNRFYLYGYIKLSLNSLKEGRNSRGEP
jgi:hypothetical protein